MEHFTRALDRFGVIFTQPGTCGVKSDLYSLPDLKMIVRRMQV